LVVMEKVAEVCPAATSSIAGTMAAGLLLDRLTAAPPAGATVANVTVPMLPVPPVTVEGDAEMLASVARLAGGGLTVSVVLTELIELAAIVAVRVALTTVLPIAKLAEV